MTLAIGERIPDVELVNHFGEPVDSAALRGAPALLVFFPFAYTPVCEGELSALAEREPAWRERGVRVLGVSVDHRYALRETADRLGVGFELLSDFWPHGAAAQAFGCFDAERGHATRASFLVSAQGRLLGTLNSEHGAPRALQDYESLLGLLGVGDA